jgi:glycosyltransferase involved in cell wall biosynthesis
MSGEGRPLSIAHVVVTDLFAGVERYICQVANELADRGHQVAAFGGDQQRMRIELADEVGCHPASTMPSAAMALIRARAVDVVHVHMTAAEGAAVMSRPWQRAPILATRHFASERGSSPVARTLAKLTSRSIRCDIAISQFVADHVGGPTVLIPNGTSIQPQAPLEEPTVVMLQRLDTEKDPELGIRAWAMSGLGDRGWQLVIAGTGELRPSLEALTGRLGVAQSVSFAGRIDDTDRFLEGASIFLAPAPREPFGLSVVEAMAHGVPVVAANGGAHIETVADATLLFTPGDPGAAAKMLISLSEDPALRATAGAGLRLRQQRDYSIAHHVDRLEDLYRSVLSDSGRP